MPLDSRHTTCFHTHTHTHSHTPSLTHSLHSLTHSLTHMHTHSFTLTHSLTRACVQAPANDIGGREAEMERLGNVVRRLVELQLFLRASGDVCSCALALRQCAGAAGRHLAFPRPELRQGAGHRLPERERRTRARVDDVVGRLDPSDRWIADDAFG